MWYVPNNLYGLMYSVALVIIVLAFIFGLFILLNDLPDIIHNKKNRKILAFFIVILMIPQLYAWIFSGMARVERYLFMGTDTVLLSHSPFVFPRSAANNNVYKKSYCTDNFSFNGYPLTVTSRSAQGIDRPVCGIFFNQTKSDYIRIPYKKLPNGMYAYWANLGTIYLSKLAPKDLVTD